MLKQNKTTRYMVKFLLLFPVLVLALSSTQILLPRPPGIHLDKPMEVILYFIRPTQQGIGEFFGFLWMLWPGLFLYLWKKKLISTNEHLIYQAYPYILFLFHHAFQLIIGKGLAPFYYLQLDLAIRVFLFGLVMGYPLAIILYGYLALIEKKRPASPYEKIITYSAKKILIFCAVVTILLFIGVYGMNMYIGRALKWIQGKTVAELPHNLENIQRQLYFIRQHIQKTGEYLLMLWPPLATFMIWSKEIKEFRVLFLLAPVFFVLIHEVFARLVFLLFGLGRGFELFYFLLLKPVITGYIIAMLLVIHLSKQKYHELSK